MTDDAPTGSEQNIPLPDMHRGELDRSELEALFSDIQGAGTDIQVRAKGAPGGQSVGVETATLTEILGQLLDGSARSVQISYTHEGVRWIDTVRRVGELWEIVRMRAFS